MDPNLIQQLLSLLSFRKRLSQPKFVSPEGTPPFVPKTPMEGLRQFNQVRPPAQTTSQGTIPSSNLWQRIMQLLPQRQQPVAPPSIQQRSPWEMKPRNFRQYYEDLGKFSRSPEYQNVIAKK